MPADLPVKYQFSYFIGEILRNDLYAENELLVFRRRLSEGGVKVKLTDGMKYGVVLEQVRGVLEKQPMPDEFRQLALRVVAEVKSGHDYRNEVAHELMVQGFGDPVAARGLAPDAVPKTFSDMEARAALILQGMWRLRGLHVIAPWWVGGEQPDWQDGADLRSWTRVAMGEIADNPQQVVGTPGPSPEPPGGYPVP